MKTALDRACDELVDKDTEIARLRTALDRVVSTYTSAQAFDRDRTMFLIAVDALSK